MLLLAAQVSSLFSPTALPASSQPGDAVHASPGLVPNLLRYSPPIVTYGELAWNIPEVVAEEKLIRFTSIESFFRVSKYIKAVVVLAVPLPPTMSTGCRCFYIARYVRHEDGEQQAV